MMRRFLFLLALLTLPAVVGAQQLREDATTVRFQFAPLTATGAGPEFNVQAYGVAEHTLVYLTRGTVSAVTIALECSTDGGATFGTSIGSASTTTGGRIAGTAYCTHIRPNVTTLTGGGSIVPVYTGRLTPADPYGAPFARQDHPNRIRCTVTVSTATTIQAVGGSCVAPGAGLSIYVTDILFASSASGIAADAFATLKYGTGGTCGTGTTVFWGALSAAANITVDNLTTPIKIPGNNELCWINTTAGSKFLVIRGFIAP